MRRNTEALRLSRCGIEIWKSIDGYNGKYEVSNLGRVRSGAINLKLLWRGYPSVNLYNDGTVVQHYVHRLVLSAFCGEKPKWAETRHLDGDPSNNKLYNIKYGTTVDNQKDRVKHGTSNRGAFRPSTKLLEIDVIEIKRLLTTSKRGDVKLIANRYGVSSALISRIKHGTSRVYG